jgi:hypothetical protein
MYNKGSSNSPKDNTQWGGHIKKNASKDAHFTYLFTWTHYIFFPKSMSKQLLNTKLHCGTCCYNVNVPVICQIATFWQYNMVIFKTCFISINSSQCFKFFKLCFLDVCIFGKISWVGF